MRPLNMKLSLVSVFITLRIESPPSPFVTANMYCHSFLQPKAPWIIRPKSRLRSV